MLHCNLPIDNWENYGSVDVQIHSPRVENQGALLVSEESGFIQTTGWSMLGDEAQGEVVCKLCVHHGAFQQTSSLSNQGTKIPEGSRSHTFSLTVWILWRTISKVMWFVFLFFPSAHAFLLFWSFFSRGELHAHLWFLVLVSERKVQKSTGHLWITNFVLSIKLN